ncbi:MAG: glycosyltransferase family 87 protein [Candidatus Acidiferrales bacterium]
MDILSRRKLTIALLVVAAGLFTARGPVRAYRYRNAWVDFAAPYVEARCWLKGVNPYDPNAYLAEWRATGGYGLEVLGGRGASATPYVPAFLPLVAPLAVLPWTIARVLWIAITCALVLLLAGCASRIRGPTALDEKLLILAIVLMAPATHTLIWTGNVTLVSVLCCVAGYYWSEQRDRAILAGIMVALCAAAKPQIGVCVLLFYLVSRKWRLLATAFATLGVLTAVFWIWLLRHGASWVQPYLTMMHNYLGPGMSTDFAGTDIRRFNLLNVQVILSTFVSKRNLSNGLGIMLVMGMFSIWLFYFARVRTQEERLLAFGTLLTLGILPVYHRVYDTLLLVVPAVWAIGNFAPSWRTLVRTLRILLACFLLPTGSALVAAVEAKRIPQPILREWWWNSLVMPHQVWLLLGVSAVLLLSLRKLTLSKEQQITAEPIGRDQH